MALPPPTATTTSCRRRAARGQARRPKPPSGRASRRRKRDCPAAASCTRSKSGKSHQVAVGHQQRPVAPGGGNCGKLAATQPLPKVTAVGSLKVQALAAFIVSVSIGAAPAPRRRPRRCIGRGWSSRWRARGRIAQRVAGGLADRRRGTSSPRSASGPAKMILLRVEQLVELMRHPAVHAARGAHQRSREVGRPRARRPARRRSSIRPRCAASEVFRPAFRPRSAAATMADSDATCSRRAPACQRHGPWRFGPILVGQFRGHRTDPMADLAGAMLGPVQQDARSPPRPPRCRSGCRRRRSSAGRAPRQTRVRPGPSSGCCFPGRPARRTARSAARPAARCSTLDEVVVDGDVRHRVDRSRHAHADAQHRARVARHHLVNRLLDLGENLRRRVGGPERLVHLPQRLLRRNPRPWPSGCAPRNRRR